MRFVRWQRNRLPSFVAPNSMLSLIGNLRTRKMKIFFFCLVTLLFFTFFVVYFLLRCASRLFTFSWKSWVKFVAKWSLLFHLPFSWPGNSFVPSKMLPSTYQMISRISRIISVTLNTLKIERIFLSTPVHIFENVNSVTRRDEMNEPETKRKREQEEKWNRRMTIRQTGWSYDHFMCFKCENCIRWKWSNVKFLWLLLFASLSPKFKSIRFVCPRRIFVCFFFYRINTRKTSLFSVRPDAKKSRITLIKITQRHKHIDTECCRRCL